MSFEGSEHFPSQIVVSYDSLVPLSILVDLAIGLNSGVKHQVTRQDGDIGLAEEGGRVNCGSQAALQILIRAAGLRAGGAIPGQGNKGLIPPDGA